MEPWLVSAVVGGIGGGLAVLILGLAMPRRKCPCCGEPFPRFRKPANRRQAMWDEYERLKEEEYDDSPWTREELEALAWETGKGIGWEGMDEYDQLPEKP